MLYPSAVASFLMPNHLAGSTGSLYKEEFFISSGNRLVSFARGCKRKDGSQTLSHSSAEDKMIILQEQSKNKKMQQFSNIISNKIIILISSDL